MESQSAQTPLKVCPSCSVASRTDADACPSCGKPYARRRAPRSRWWFAIPIVALAFAVGYGGRMLIQGGDSEPAPEGISFQQGASTPLHVSRPELLNRLGGQQPALTKHPKGQTCLLYLVTDQAYTDWRFCFQRGKLVTSNTVVNAPG